MKNVIALKRSLYYNWLSLASEAELRTMLAFINNLCWVAADRSKLIKKRANGKVKIIGSLQKLKLSKVCCATTGMSKYIQKFWPKAWHSRPNLIKIRKAFEDMGLFEIEARTFADRRRFPTVYTNLKIADLLICAEVIEELLCEVAYNSGNFSRKSAIATLPAHKGYGIVLLFNEMFKGFTKWRRKTEESPLWNDASEVELELFDIMFQSDSCQVGW